MKKQFSHLSDEEILTEVGKHFDIQVWGVNFVGPAIKARRIAAKQLVELLKNDGMGGTTKKYIPMVARICRKALNCKEEKYWYTLSRGIKLKFSTPE